MKMINSLVDNVQGNPCTLFVEINPNEIQISSILMNKLICLFKENKKEKIVLGWIGRDGVLEDLQELRSYGNENYSIFYPEMQIKYIKSCIMNKKSPILFHNHLYLEDSDFSKPDISFFCKFFACYEKMGGIDCMFAALFNNEAQTMRFIQIKKGSANDESIY